MDRQYYGVISGCKSVDRQYYRVIRGSKSMDTVLWGKSETVNRWTDSIMG